MKLYRAKLARKGRGKGKKYRLCDVRGKSCLVEAGTVSACWFGEGRKFWVSCLSPVALTRTHGTPLDTRGRGLMALCLSPAKAMGHRFAGSWLFYFRQLMAVLYALSIVIPGEAKRRPGTQLAVPVFTFLGPGYSATRNSGMTILSALLRLRQKPEVPPHSPACAGEGGML